MSKVKKGHSTLLGLVESDSEDNQFIDAMPTPDSAVENLAATKKGRGRPKGLPTKATKTKTAARRTSGRLTGKARTKGDSVLTKNRAPLSDKTNQQYTSETEEVDDFDQNEDIEMDDISVEKPPPAAKGKKSKAVKVKALGKQKVSKDVSNINHADSVESLESPKLQPKKGRQTRKEPIQKLSPEKIILETQVEADVEDEVDMEFGEGEEVVETVTKAVQSIARQKSDSRPRQTSVQRRRAGSASDTERNDPVLRRKLGEITKKYESLHLKYQDLREIGLKEAERNFEKLRKQSEEKTKISNDLIATLKAENVTQAALVKESRAIKKKLDTQIAETTALKAQLAKLQITLAEAQSETKTLSAKLAANRQAAASVESASSKVPGSAIKAVGGIRMIGTVEAAQAAQAAQLKEDIYSDLTGLIIRSVKREADEDIFDCIQTGRNGTLHFKLATGNDKSAESYDDVQCSYIPQLDPSRDKSLIELLPDYLVDEITFPRPHAAKFYARVVKALTEKPLEP